MPLGKGFSVGLLLSYERSQFSAVAVNSPDNYVKYQTNWLPSGGFGFTWQNKRFLVGFRGLFNQDMEKRIDNAGVSKGLNFAHEYRLGIAIGLWKGALIDLGGNLRYRYNQIAGTKTLTPAPNVGFEQNFWDRRIAVRAGYDESSPTGGISLRFHPIVCDIAYVYNLGMARFGNLFGTRSHSIIATFVFDYGYFIRKKH